MRPSTVTVGLVLLRAVGLAYIADVFVLVSGIGGVPDNLRAQLAEAGVDATLVDMMKPLTTGMTIFAAIVTAAIGFGFLLLARFARPGRSGIHVTTLVATGLAAVGGLGLVSIAGTPVPAGYLTITASSAVGPNRFRGYAGRLTDLYDPGYRTANLIVGLIAVALAAAAFVFLIRPTSRAYFPGPRAGVPLMPGLPVPMPAMPTAAPIPEQAPSEDLSELGPELAAELTAVRRRHEQGEISDAQYSAELDRLLLRDDDAA